MYRVSYTVDGGGDRTRRRARTRRTEYFATEPEALARIRQLLDDGNCIAVCAGKRSSRAASARLDLQVAACSNGLATERLIKAPASAQPLLPLAEN
jgi:hypothetical protein